MRKKQTLAPSVSHTAKHTEITWKKKKKKKKIRRYIYFEGYYRKLLWKNSTLPRLYFSLFVGRSQTVVSSVKWHVKRNSGVFRNMYRNMYPWCSPCMLLTWSNQQVIRINRHCMVKHRRKLSEQEGGTSKFGKVAFNWAISSAIEHQSGVTTVFYPTLCTIPCWGIVFNTVVSLCVVRAFIFLR